VDPSPFSYALAFLGGLVSFASPCVLPLVPSFLSFVAGKGEASPRFGRTVFFVLGFSLVFIVLGVVFTGGSLAFGGTLSIVRVLSGLVVMVFAVQMVFPFLSFLNYEKRVHISHRPSNAFEALLVGMAFGAGWTPCIGPMLSAILFLAGIDKTMAGGILYLTLYTLGLGIPFLAGSLWIDHFKPLLGWMRRHSRSISWTGATVMFVMGLLILSGQFTIVPRTMIQWGVVLQDWSTSTEGVGLSHWIATAVYSLFFILPAGLFLIRTARGKRAVPMVGSTLSGLWFLLGGTLIWGEWTGTFLLFAQIGAWLQFQGL